MASLNKVIIMGNLTRDVEMQYTTSGTAVAKFAVAVTEKYNDKETTAFIDVTAWKKQAENCAKFIGKGSCVLVEGKWTVDEWDDKDTGKKRQKAYVTALNVTFVSKPQNQQAQQPPQQSFPQQAGGMDIPQSQADPEGDIPF